MGFKRSPFPMIQGTKGHSSALKKTSALKQVVKGGTKTWKEGEKASGNRLDELVKSRGKHEKGTAEYNAIQNEINRSLGSKVRRTTKDEKGEEVSPKGTEKTEIASDGKTTTEDRVKGLGREEGKTLTYTQKAAQTEKLKGAKLRKLEAKKQTADIKSGKDDPKTGTKVSRWVAGKKSKRLERKIERVATGKTRKEQRQERRAKRKADKESPLTQKGPKGLGDMSERARKPENLIEKRKRQMKETQIFSKENVAKRSKAAKDKEIEKNLPWQKTITRKSMPKFSKKK